MSNFRQIFFSGIIWKTIFYFTSFFLNLLLANYLGAANSAPLFFVLNNLTIVVFVLGFGVDSSLNYFNARKEFAFKKLVALGVAWSGVAALLFFALYPLLTQAKFIVPIASPVVFVLFVLGAFLTANLTSLFLSSDDTKTPNVIPAIINSLLIMVVAIQFSPTALFDSKEALFEAYFLSAFVVGILLLVFMLARKQLYQPSHHTGFDKKKFIQYSSAVFMANLFITLLMRSDVWLVNYLSTAEALGNYLQTAKFLQLILVIPTLASFTLFPLITRHLHEGTDIHRKLVKLVSSYFYIALAICVVIAATGYWLFPLLYGNTFSMMYLTFLCFIPGAVALAASYPLTPYFSGKNMNSVITINSFLAIVIMFAIDIVLIPKLSIYGAAIGSSVAYCFYFLRLLYIFRRMHRFPISEAFHYGSFYNELLTLVQRVGK